MTEKKGWCPRHKVEYAPDQTHCEACAKNRSLVSFTVRLANKDSRTFHNGPFTTYVPRVYPSGIIVVDVCEEWPGYGYYTDDVREAVWAWGPNEWTSLIKEYG